MNLKLVYIAPTLFATLFLVGSLWGQVEEVDIILGDSIQIIKTHQPPFSPTNVVFVENFGTIPDPVSASLDSIVVNEQGNAFLAYLKLKLDVTAEAGEVYDKALSLIYLSGQSTATFEHQFRISAKSVTSTGEFLSVAKVALFQNFPNPASTSTTIEFFLPGRRQVSIWLFNQLGQRVRALVDGQYLAGHHQLTFDCAKLPAGLYFYTLTTKGFSASKRLLVTR